MIAISAPAPTPPSQAEAFAAVAARRQSKPSSPNQIAREALAELASVARNVRFDLNRCKRDGDASPVTPKYVEEIGLRVLEIVDRARSVEPRGWDALIDQLSDLVPKRS